MKSKHKALLLSMCAVLLVAATVFGTFAYLTDQESATNTFTVGSVGLTLDEADVKPDGTLETEDRVQANEYHLLPGHTYIKDPTVTVEEGSEASYIRMMVQVDNIDKLKEALPAAKYYGEDGVFLLQNLVSGWDNGIWVYEGYTEKKASSNPGDSAIGSTSVVGDVGIYEFRYHRTAKGADEVGQQLDIRLEPLFTHITVPGEVDNDGIAHLQDVKIVVTAHAIQADGFEDADAAWAAFGAQHP